MPQSVDGDIRISVDFDNNGIQKGVRSTESAIAGLKSSIAGFGKAVAAAFSVAAIVNFGKQAIDAASDIQEVQNVVDTAFGEMSYKAEEFAETAIESFGMSKLSAKQTASTYMAMAKSMGLSMDTASDMAIEVAKLTGDVASFYNLDQSTAATKLKGIFTGETEALKDLGVVMTEVNLQEYALSKGITKQYSAMSQSEKVMLRYEYVTNALSDASGDFIRTQDSWANQTRILSERWKEFMSEIGSSLITVLTPLLQLLNGIVSALTAFAQKVNTLVTALAGSNAQETEQSNTIAQSVKNQNALTDAVNETAKAQEKSLAGFDEINKISSNAAEVTTQSNLPFSTQTSTATGDITPINADIETLAERIKQAFEPLKTIDTSNLETSLTNLKNSLGGLGEEAFSGLLWGVENVLPEIAGFTIETILPSFLDLLSTAVDTAKETFKKAKTPFKTFYEECLKPLADYTKPKIAEYLDDLNKKLEELKTMVEETEAFDDLNEILSSLSGILTTVGELIIDFKLEQLKFSIGQAWITFKYKLKDIEDALGLIAALLRGDFSDAFEHAKDLLIDNKIDQAKERFENLKTTIQSVTTSIANFASEMKSAVTEAFNNWKDGVSEWWENDVSPWFTAEKWSELLQSIGASLALAVAGMRNIWNEQILPWWEEDVKPWFTAEKWEAIWSDAKASVKHFFTGEDGFVQTWKSRITSWWENEVLPWFTFERWQTFGNDMREGIISGFKNIINGIATIINKTIDSFEKLVNSVIWGLNQIIAGYNTMASVVNLPTIDLLNKIDLSKYKLPTAAQGTTVPYNISYMSFVNGNAIDTDTLAEKINAQGQKEELTSLLASSIGVQNDILEAILGIQIGDDVIGKAALRYNNKRKIMYGG